MVIDMVVVFVMGVALGYIVSSGMINYKWVDAAELSGFVKYNKKFYKVSEIVIEEDEDNEEEDTDK